MNARRAAQRPLPTERYVAWIEGHLGRMAQGHDPMGHLFAIERLARSARSEWWEAHREGARERQPQ